MINKTHVYACIHKVRTFGSGEDALQNSFTTSRRALTKRKRALTKRKRAERTVRMGGCGGVGADGSVRRGRCGGVGAEGSVRRGRC